METGTGTLTTFDNLVLRFHWQRPPHPKGVIVIVHGLADHMNRYRALCSSLGEHGFAIYGYDQRGHGLSQGPRADVERFLDYARDLGQFIRHVQHREPDLGLFVFSHSMGAVVAIHTLIHDDLDVQGLIVSAYPCRLAAGMPYWQRLICRAAARVYPAMRVSSRLEASELSHDPQIVEDYTRDDLVARTVTMRWLNEFLKACEQLRGGPIELQLPVLVLHGESDRVAAPEGAVELMNRLSTPDKSMKTYPGFKHELHNERTGEESEYREDVRRWLDDHVQRSMASTRTPADETGS